MSSQQFVFYSCNMMFLSVCYRDLLDPVVRREVLERREREA